MRNHLLYYLLLMLSQVLDTPHSHVIPFLFYNGGGSRIWTGNLRSYHSVCGRTISCHQFFSWAFPLTYHGLCCRKSFLYLPPQCGWTFQTVSFCKALLSHLSDRRAVCTRSRSHGNPHHLMPPGIQAKIKIAERCWNPPRFMLFSQKFGKESESPFPAG